MFSEFVTSTLTASVNFSNGSTWSTNFNFDALENLNNEDIFYADSWLSCVGDKWHNLPSGRSICLINSISNNEDRRTVCRNAGGYLAEITNRDDAQALLYLMYQMNKNGEKSTSIFAIGGKAVDGQWIWMNSGKEVEIGAGKLLKPTSEEVDLYPYTDHYLYLSLFNPPSSSGQDFMSSPPYFDLFVTPGLDSEEEFLCMRNGEV